MKKLPISDIPYVRTYTYHAYMNAIIQKTTSDILAIIKFPEEIFSNLLIEQEKVDIAEENNEIIIKSNPYERNNYCSFFRKIKNNDSFIVEIIHQQYIHYWGNIQLFITNNGSNTLDNNSYLFAYGNFSGDGLFIKNYDSFCDINKLYSDDIQYPLLLKINVTENKISFFYSNDKQSWNLCYECTINDNLLNDFYIGVKVELSAAENMYYNWLFSNYIQIMLNSGWVNSPNIVALDYFVTPQKNYNYYTIHNLLDFKYENPKMILESYNSIINFIIHQINHNFYVEILLNEKYIENRKVYQKDDENHTNLIYGYNEDLKLLYIMGFNKTSKPELGIITYDMFNMAYNTSDINANIYLLKYVPDTKIYKLNKRHIISSIDDYLNGKNTSNNYGNLFMPLDFTFGIHVYDELMKNDKTIDIFMHDVRISYLLFEHKKIMRDRISYLITQGIINATNSIEIVNFIKKIYSQSEIINNLVIKYGLNNNNHIKDKITLLMNDVKELEMFCYVKLLDLLKKE